VTATVTELGTLAVMGQEDVSLQDLRVSPNPFRLGSDTEVTFANMAEQATLRIFTASGREVRRLEETDGDGVLRWDGKNSSGDSVSPGVYLYHVQSPGAEKKGKVMVLR
jgi:flagellar hook assembly protein FlgD